MRFAKGIRKLTGNVNGDRRKEDWRTCRKITGGCRSMREWRRLQQGRGCNRRKTGQRCIWLLQRRVVAVWSKR
ncbi:hypothetical protein BHM03_00022061 [Ensete ventricosum]|nr:hypothetical protein BHM03_00022061 [Ensete ventricosum]